MAGKHFDPTSTAGPVTNDTTIRIVLLLMLIVDWMARIYDTKGMLLKGKFENGKEIFMGQIRYGAPILGFVGTEAT